MRVVKTLYYLELELFLLPNMLVKLASGLQTQKAYREGCKWVKHKTNCGQAEALCPLERGTSTHF